jgi:hypothetical protein
MTTPTGGTAAKEGGLGRPLVPGLAAVADSAEVAARRKAEALKDTSDRAADALSKEWNMAREDEEALIGSPLVPVFREIGESLARLGHRRVSLLITDFYKQWSDHLHQALHSPAPTRPKRVRLALIWGEWGEDNQEYWREISGYCKRGENGQIEGYGIHSDTKNEFTNGLTFPTTATPEDIGRALDNRSKLGLGYEQHTFDTRSTFQFMRTIASFDPLKR